MLKPKDINEVQFSKSFKGYDPDEVDKFLDKVTEDYAQLYRENAELMNKLEILAAKLTEYKNAEENIRAAKEKVYRMAQELASKAKSEAAQIEREARERAERIVIEAKRDCENQRRLYERLQLEVTRFKAKSIALFKSEIEQLNTLPDLAVDAKDELRIRADEMSNEDDLSSPFVEVYKPKFVAPATIDFGVIESDESKAKKEEEAKALKATAVPEEDFAVDYTGKTEEVKTEENDEQATVAFSVPVTEVAVEEKKDVSQTAVFDIGEDTHKPAFVIKRVTEEKAEETEGSTEQNGWHNETEEFDVLESGSIKQEEKKEENGTEHPKFGQLRFGSDYDITEEDDRGFSFFKKKK